MHWEIRPHIGTTKSNIQTVDKHLEGRKEGIVKFAQQYKKLILIMNVTSIFMKVTKKKKKIIIIKNINI